MVVLYRFEGMFEVLVRGSVLLIECVGVAVLLATTFRSVGRLISGKGQVQLPLAQGIALALEFKLGGEVLNTLVVREWNELLLLGGIILLRGALTVLIHWEIKNERACERAPAKPSLQGPAANTSPP